MFLPSYYRVGQKHTYGFGGVKFTKIPIGNGYFSQNRKIEHRSTRQRRMRFLTNLSNI